jgi:hypothetical protein
MADVAPPPASVGDFTSKPRPEKPEEAKYKADLAAAEKEHATAMAKYVCVCGRAKLYYLITKPIC